MRRSLVCCVHQLVDLGGERPPLMDHQAKPSPALGRQPVVLAWMCGRGLPFGVEPPVAREPAEDGIDGAFGDDEVGQLLEVPDDLEAVARARRDGEQDGEFEAASPHLLGPGVSRDRHRGASCRTIPCVTMLMTTGTAESSSLYAAWGLLEALSARRRSR